MLDNPIWNALRTSQAHLAQGGPSIKRYPADIAPFLATAGPEANAHVFTSASSTVMELGPPGETLYMIGVTLAPPSGWEVEHQSLLSQMIYRDHPHSNTPMGNCSILGPGDVPDMLELTSVAFPGFFKARTIELGHYFGIRQGTQLVAMAGERMFLTGYREISGVCTHPDHRGRGYARQLILRVAENILGQGLTPFLHVAAENTAARRVYENLGFVERVELPMLRVKRAASSQ